MKIEDSRPSISELQAGLVRDTFTDEGRMIEAAPAILEIAAAALLQHGPCDHPEGRCANGSHFRGCSRFDGEARMRLALAKVRP